MRLAPLATALALAGCGGSESTVDAAADQAAALDFALAPICLAPSPDLGAAFDPACPIQMPAQPDTLDEALARAGIDRCHFGFSKADWSIFPPSVHEDPFRLPWFDPVHDYAVRAPPFARELVAELDQAAASPSPVAEALLALAGRLGPSPDPCAPAAATDPAQPLARAVASLAAAGGGSPDEATLEADAADVPLDLQQAAAEVILAIAEADRAIAALLAPLTADQLTALGSVAGLELLSGFIPPDVTDPRIPPLLATFDEPALAAAAVHLAQAVEHAELARFAGATGFHFDQPTPLGRVVIADAADDDWPDDPDHPIALLLDTGGNDTYHGAVGAVDGLLDPTNLRRVAVAVDLAGQDDYRYDPKPDPKDGTRLPSDVDGRYHPPLPVSTYGGPISLSEQLRQGAGRLGIGMLFDLGQEGDHYRSLRMSQGFGVAGVGMLYDAGGDDTYEGEAAVQGGAIFGLGLLFDAGGNDTYKTYNSSQGFAFVRAVGALYDGAGNDQYLADPGDPAQGGDPLYLNAQLPGRGNTSLVQGAGFGRNPQKDTVFMSGGLGILRDRSGDDAYVASVFAQATGYWFGTGILADGGGKDRYDGLWYVQGADAHFALCVFLEDSGDDLYNSTLVPAATSIGVGHDFSVAWHIDSGGSDIYRAPGLSLGAGNANGVGVLVNLGGDDEYHAPGEPTLGCGNLSSEVDGDLARRGVPTTGIFIDVGGHDVYDAPSNVVRGDDTSWIDTRELPDSGVTTEHGAGIDATDGGVSLP